MHYTAVHKNCRVGAYIHRASISEFVPLKQIIPWFDFFVDVVETNFDYTQEKYFKLIDKIGESRYSKQVEKVWRLESPIWFEFETKTLTKKIFGYTFKKPFQVRINPNDIESLEGSSLSQFRIKVKDFCLSVRFRDQVQID